MTERFTVKELYIYKGKYYILESDPFESKERFNMRAWYIIKYMDDNKIKTNKLAEVITLSRIWLNEQVLNAKYESV